MKVGIITCNRANNYGARLQAYALWRHLTMMGHDTSVIDYCPPYLDFNIRLLYNPGASVKEWVKLLVRYAERQRSIRKFEYLEEFSSKMTHLTDVRYNSIKELRTNPPVADVYIAGSDQIWNTRFANGQDPAFYLDFGNMRTRRISYAASFATESIDDSLSDFIRQSLKRMDAVSVREDSGRKIAADLGIEAEVCCDPAFLLDASQWDEICAPRHTDERFLMVYDLEKSANIKEVAKKIAKSERLKVYSMSNRPLGYSDRDFSDCTPSIFLWLIKNAEYVVSNSLHATIFSIIFRKDFFVVDRDDGLNVRMHDLLRGCRLNHRIVFPDTDQEELQSHIDYSDVCRIVNSNIESSKKWLSNNLSIKG